MPEKKFESHLRAKGAQIREILSAFAKCESGATTVEWVALAAGLTIGAIAISFIVMQGIAGAAANIGTQLTPPS